MFISCKCITFFSLLLFVYSTNTKVTLMKSGVKLNSKQNVTVTTPSRYAKDDERFFTINGPCLATSCHSPFAFCSNPTQCVCLNGFAHNPSADNQQNPNNTYCTYQQKKQLTAFLLEFFFPFGAGHFYSNRDLFGVLKLILYISFCVFYCLFNSMKKPGEAIADMNIKMLCFAALQTCLCCGVLIWQIVDLVKFGSNSYKDGKGVPLSEW